MRTLFIFLVLTASAWAQDWTVAQNSDSIDFTYIRSDVATSNFGANATTHSPQVSYLGAATALLRPALDYRTAGYTQDSMVVTLTPTPVAYGKEPTQTTDTVWVNIYLMGNTGGVGGWQEGNESNATADSLDCDWSAAVTEAETSTDSITWNTAGAKGPGSDRASSPIDSFFVDSAMVANATTVSFRVVGNDRVDSAFSYGIILDYRRSVGTITTLGPQFCSDDFATGASRPLIEGYESAPAGALEVAPIQLGPGEYGPN